MQGTKVLFVDDEIDILKPVARYFAGLGCEVDVAGELEEAQAVIAHRGYDLFVLDLCLSRFPGSQGLQVLREVRARNRFAAVIVLSGLLSSEVAEEATRSGANAVLRKPQRLGELARIAFRILGLPEEKLEELFGPERKETSNAEAGAA